ncbi:hypothetical protein P692DRAFT_20880133 [Suillus brevipes Sb2]|nr:hypothetical protein P692DRAFT_20880133 [Suillus brevipes Sb2]
MHNTVDLTYIAIYAIVRLLRIKSLHCPSDRFGFKPSQSQATHPVGHNHKEASSDVAEQDLENRSGSGDLDDFDEWGKSADEHETQDERRAADDDFREYDDGPALTDSPPGGDGNELMEIDETNLDTMMGAQIQSLMMSFNTIKRRTDVARLLPRPVYQASLIVSPLRHVLLPLASSLPSVHLEKGHLQRLVMPMGVVIPRPIDHLIDAPRLGQRLSLLAQGLHIQAGVVITLSADHLLCNTPRLSQQPFSLAQDLHIGVHPVDHLLDIPHCGHQIGEPLDSITRGLIPLFQAVLTRILVVPHLNQGTETNP